MKAANHIKSAVDAIAQDIATEAARGEHQLMEYSFLPAPDADGRNHKRQAVLIDFRLSGEKLSQQILVLQRLLYLYGSPSEIQARPMDLAGASSE